MKTLIFNGSPRKSGATSSIVSYLQQSLPGEIAIVNSYTANLSPCIDCRYCSTHPNCAIQDEMQKIYTHIQQADVILLASPVYFAQLTGPLLSLASRLQCLWKNKPTEKPRFGGVILVEGGMGLTKDAFAMGKRLLHIMGADCNVALCHSGTDNPDRENPLTDTKTMHEINELVLKIKEFAHENH